MAWRERAIEAQWHLVTLCSRTEGGDGDRRVGSSQALEVTEVTGEHEATASFDRHRDNVRVDDVLGSGVRRVQPPADQAGQAPVEPGLFAGQVRSDHGHHGDGHGEGGGDRPPAPP